MDRHPSRSTTNYFRSCIGVTARFLELFNSEGWRKQFERFYMYTYRKEFLFPVFIMGNLGNCVFPSQISRNHGSEQPCIPETFTYNFQVAVQNAFEHVLCFYCPRSCFLTQNSCDFESRDLWSLMQKKAGIVTLKHITRSTAFCTALRSCR